MIIWCKKVPQKLISHFYNQSALGIFGDELVDEVGYALYARCKSIVSVTNGFEKKYLICPTCDVGISFIENSFVCSCGFNATWEEFRLSYKGKQLYAANALPIFIDYMKSFLKARSYVEKLIAIDVLIHSFHIKNSYHNKNYDIEDKNIEINRPTGANLIEGSLSDVILFLDRLSAVDDYSQSKAQWRNNIERANGGSILMEGRFND